MNVIVVGAGGFGSWSALKLQQAGCNVTLVDAWGAGNSRSSSGGETRVIRTVYGQDDFYIEMAAQSMEEWDRFQESVGKSLMEMTGSLWLCGEDDSYIQAAMLKMESLGMPLQDMTREAPHEWPQISFDDIQKVFLEPRSGFLRARQACQVIAQEFVQQGGNFYHGAALPPKMENPKNEVHLASGETLCADQVVWAAGPWLKTILPNELNEILSVTRQEVYYFGTPAGDPSFGRGTLPIWLELNEPIYYGLPSIDNRGFKLARDERGEEFDPTRDSRHITGTLLAQAREYMAHRFPKLDSAPLIESRVCQYTNSLDGHFIMDRVESSEQIVVGGGCGHGFKMGPAIGDLVVQLVLHNRTSPHFELGRFENKVKRSTQFDHS